jgi:hypothetical protein
VPFARANDIDLYYELAGAGERLLFISGTGAGTCAAHRA